MHSLHSCSSFRVLLIRQRLPFLSSWLHAHAWLLVLLLPSLLPVQSVLRRHPIPLALCINTASHLECRRVLEMEDVVIVKAEWDYSGNSGESNWGRFGKQPGFRALWWVQECMSTLQCLWKRVCEPHNVLCDILWWQRWEGTGESFCYDSSEIITIIITFLFKV